MLEILCVTIYCLTGDTVKVIARSTVARVSIGDYTNPLDWQMPAGPTNLLDWQMPAAQYDPDWLDVIAEYIVADELHNEPVFPWWVPYVLKKRDATIKKVRPKYWLKTHKFDIQIPKSVKEAIDLDKEDRDAQWWDSIVMEMVNVRYDGNDNPTGSSRATEVLMELKKSIKSEEYIVEALRTASHASNQVTRQSHSGIIVLFCNECLVIWYSKRQNTVESSTFGSKFIAGRIAVDLIEALLQAHVFWRERCVTK